MSGTSKSALEIFTCVNLTSIQPFLYAMGVEWILHYSTTGI